MEKTKLGLSVSLMAVVMCLTGMFAGYVAAVLVAGYILIVEDNKFLKQTAVKVIALMFALSLASSVINFIPYLSNIIESFVLIFFEYFNMNIVNRIFNFFDSILVVVRIVAFAVLSFMAWKEKTVKVDFIDKIFE